MPFCELDFKQNKNEITAILINKVMRKEQTKRDYSAPSCMIVQVNATTYLMETSFPNDGGHKEAPTGGVLNAKRAYFEEEDEED